MGSFPEMYNAPFKDLIRKGRFYARDVNVDVDFCVYYKNG